MNSWSGLRTVAFVIAIASAAACSSTSAPDASPAGDDGIGSTDASLDTRTNGDAAIADAVDVAADASTIIDTFADTAREVSAPPDVHIDDVPASSDVGTTCVGRPAGCVNGVAGGACGDAIVPPDCVAGAWVCPAGTVPVTSCGCVGRPPSGCTCGPAGWLCPDAGTADVSSSTIDCAPAHATCRMLPPTCAGGQVPSVVGTCWGVCVDFSVCAPITCDPAGSPTQCPNGTACYTLRRTCGPLV